MKAVERGGVREESLHAEEVGVEDGGEEELVDYHFCRQGEERRGIVEAVAQIDEPIP